MPRHFHVVQLIRLSKPTDQRAANVVSLARLQPGVTLAFPSVGAWDAVAFIDTDDREQMQNATSEIASMRHVEQTECLVAAHSHGEGEGHGGLPVGGGAQDVGQGGGFPAHAMPHSHGGDGHQH